jgi:FKBP-type peptidyl-prolyl cis-trans isomerase
MLIMSSYPYICDVSLSDAEPHAFFVRAAIGCGGRFRYETSADFGFCERCKLPSALNLPVCNVMNSVIRATQAAQANNFDLALTKITDIERLLEQWRNNLANAKLEAAAPSVPQAQAEPPAESIPFSVNVTHVPAKCPRKSTEGAIMKVHYVGKLLSTGKIFASSFHTGSQPFRFTLGSEEVLAGWNDGLSDMCEGERRRLMVPWDKAYGQEGTKGVPPYSDVQVGGTHGKRMCQASSRLFSSYLKRCVCSACSLTLSLLS